jgi:hypothetical protein
VVVKFAKQPQWRLFWLGRAWSWTLDCPDTRLSQYRDFVIQRCTYLSLWKLLGCTRRRFPIALYLSSCQSFFYHFF